MKPIILRAMLCLGIESTAHTYGIGIVDNTGRILANEKAAYTTDKGGIHPSKAKEHHLTAAPGILKQALRKANISLDNVNLIAFSQSPGLAPCLVVGKDNAVALAKKLLIPIVGVNHCIAHLEIGRLLTRTKDPVLLYASGANTQVIAYQGRKYRIFGETLDQGVGNALDAFARYMGLGFPGGPKLQELAKQAKQYIELPYAVKGMDVSFTGILTSLKDKYDSGKYSREDLAYSAQETIFAMLVEVSERAIAHCQKRELLLGGGVACNTRLQEMCRIMCSERGAKCYAPEHQFLVDNGAMIAWSGLLMYKAGVRDDASIVDIRPAVRTDDVEVVWR